MHFFFLHIFFLDKVKSGKKKGYGGKKGKEEKKINAYTRKKNSRCVE